MISAREFLNSKFPTKKDKEKVKTLSVYNYPDISKNPSDDQNYYFADTFLKGIIDLNDFVNLEALYIKDQDKIEAVQGWEKLEKLSNIEVVDKLRPDFRIFLRMNGEIRQIKKTKIEEIERINNKNQDLKNALREEQNALIQMQMKNKELKIQLEQEKQKNYFLNEQLIKTKQKSEDLISKKSQELEEVVNNLRNKLDDNIKGDLDELLEANQEFIRSNNLYAQKQLEKFKKRLLKSKKVNTEEIENICQTQRKLEIELQINQLEASIETLF